MRELSRFRDDVRTHRRMAGRSQAQLARAIGLHPDVLSHKLNSHDGSVLTTRDVVGIVTALADWGALVTRSDAQFLLELMEVPPQAVSEQAWAAPPLAALRADASVQRPKAAPGPLAAAAGLFADPDPDADPAPTPHWMSFARLPAPATALIGREQDRAHVVAALADARLVTLTGPGGTGKTRLALDVSAGLGSRFVDGVAFVDLSQVSDPTLLGTALATALGLSPPSAVAAEDRLADALRAAELLLVLDNMEQLLAEAALLGRLLSAAPRLRILATSRIALRVYGELVLRVPPLNLPRDGTAASARDSPAVQLFIARARAARPGFQPGEQDLSAIGAICTSLDGLALAIELAAARVRLYPPQALLPLLRSRLDVLTGGPRDQPGRQQTLRSALDWSHQLLAARDRQLFACLGVFAGPFTAVAAAAVSGEPDQAAVLERLAELADQSMLEVMPAATPRFHLLQTVREYALARLAESGDEGATQRRLLAYCLRVTAGSSTPPAASGVGQPGWLDEVESIYPSIRAALEFACGQDDPGWVEDGLRLAIAIGWFWLRRGSLAEGMLHLSRLLAAEPGAAPGTDPGVRAWAMLQACALACFSGDYEQAEGLAQASLGLCQSLGDHQGMARARRFIGEAAMARGDYAAAEPQFDQSRAEAELAGDLLLQAEAHNMLGQIYRSRDQLDAAASTLRQAIALFQAGGNPDGAGAAMHSLGVTELHAGRINGARQLFTVALREHRQFRNRRAMAYALEGLAEAEGLTGRGRDALVYLSAAQRLRDEAGSPLPPSEQAALSRAMEPLLAAITPAEARDARAEGQVRPLRDIVASAVEEKLEDGEEVAESHYLDRTGWCAGCRRPEASGSRARQLVILVVTKPALFSRSGSGVADRASPAAIAALIPLAGTVPVIVKVSVCPGARLTTVQVVVDRVTPRKVDDLVLPPRLAVTPASPAPSRVTFTFDAATGPLSVTVIVSVTSAPGLAEAGPVTAPATSALSATTATDSCAVAVMAGFPASVTLTVNADVPDAFGVPAMTPPGLSVSPAGSEPPASDQV
jgi:predicted ATPase